MYKRQEDYYVSDSEDYNDEDDSSDDKDLSVQMITRSHPYMPDLHVGNAQEFSRLQDADGRLNVIKQRLRKQALSRVTAPRQFQTSEGITFRLHRDILLARDTTTATAMASDRFKYVIPKILQERVVMTRHEKSSHPGVPQLVAMVSEQYYWDKKYTSDESISETCSRVKRHCIKCQIFESRRQVSPLLPLLHLARKDGIKCHHTYYADLWYSGNPAAKETPVKMAEPVQVLPSSRPYTWVIGAICAYCRYAMTESLVHGTASEVQSFMLRQVFQVKPPHVVITDNGSSMTQGEMESLYESIHWGLHNLRQKYQDDNQDDDDKVSSDDGISSDDETDNISEERQGLGAGSFGKQGQTGFQDKASLRREKEKKEKSPYTEIYDIRHKKSNFFRPQSHSLIERFWQSYSRIMKKLCSGSQHLWLDLCSVVTFLYNSTPHTAISMLAPSTVHFGLPSQEIHPDIFEILHEVNENQVRRPAFLRHLKELSQEAKTILDTVLRSDGPALSKEVSVPADR